jgi:hypothetical protein
MFTAKAVAGVSIAHPLTGYDLIYFQLGTSGNANGTLKIQISFSDAKPDFSSAATATNHWTYASTIDMAPGTAVAGATGYVTAGTDIFKNIELNVGGAKWVSAELTYTAGSWNLSAYATPKFVIKD